MHKTLTYIVPRTLDEIDYDSIVDMYYAIDGKDRDSAWWTTSHGVLDRLGRLVDTAGQPLLRGSLVDSEAMRLVGRPVKIVDYLAPLVLMFGTRGVFKDDAKEAK